MALSSGEVNSGGFARDEDGRLIVTGDLEATLEAGDLQIGAVEIKDAGSDQRAAVDASGNLSVEDTAVLAAVDTLETLIAATNTKLDTLTTNIGDLDVNQEAIETLITATNAELTRTISSYVSTDIDETDEDVKASAGQVHGWHIYNDAAAEVYVFLYNTNSPTVGTTAPLIQLVLPPNGGANVMLPRPVAFGTAISVAALTGITSGNPAANQVIGTIFYS